MKMAIKKSYKCRRRRPLPGTRVKTAALLCLLVITSVISAPGFVHAESSAGPRDSVTLQLRWEHQFQFAGYYAALWEGYYDEANLDVEILPGIDDEGRVILAPDAVSSGKADFGVGGVDILLSVDQGHSLKIVSTIFQRSPTAYYMLEDQEVHSIYDLTRLNIARRESDLLDIELQAMMVNEGIDPSLDNPLKKDVVLSFENLRSKEFDVLPGYLDTIAYQAKLQGYALNTIRPLDYGVDFYGDSLFTSEALSKERPQLVERFRLATLRGWKYALDHPDEMAQRIADHYYKDSRNYLEFVDFNKFQSSRVTELTLYPIVEIGNINPYRWGQMIEYLRALELIDSDISTESLLFDFEAIQRQRSEFQIRVYQSFFAVLFISSIFIYIWSMNRKNARLKDEIKFRKETQERITISHERYQRMFNSSFLGITVTDISGHFLNVNDKWVEMTGYTQNELLGMKIFDILSDSSRASGKVQFKALRSGELHDIVLERRYVRKDRSEFWGQLYMTAIRDPETMEENFLGMVLDITEKKLQREAAERAEAMMLYQARQAAMGEMIGSIAHQWRQPLNNLGLIMTNIEDAFRFDDLDADTLSDASTRARSLISQMSETIDDFQDFLKPGVNSESFSLEDMLDTVLELSKDNLHINKIVLDRHPRTDIVLSGQKNQLAQGVFNIINNAIAAISANGSSDRTLHVRTAARISKKEDTENDSKDKSILAVIEITDHAGGIPEAIRDQIFEPYFTTRSSEGGTGLGLYITRSIVENIFHGEIRLRQTDSGSSFIIEIPTER